MPLDPDRPHLPPSQRAADTVDVVLTIRSRGLAHLAFMLRRLASQADASAVAATRRSWMIKGQAAADRCRERISEHETLAEAARTVADVLDDTRRDRGPSR